MIGMPAYRRLMTVAAVCAIGGGAAAIVGWVIYPARFYAAWLSAFCYGLGFPLGALALLMIHDLTGGKWEAVARPPLESAAATMPLFIVLFLPIVAGLHDLYPWTRPEHFVAFANRWYLNLAFFGIRAGIYFAVWSFFAFVQLRRSHGDDAAPRVAQWASGIGLILLAFTATYASIDWMMSIEPDWYSSVYGMMVGAQWFIVALAVVMLAIVFGAQRDGVAASSFRRHLANLATILLAVDIFWGYTAYSQWLIIWEENLHSEITWYLDRLSEGWRALVIVIIAIHLLIPLFTLVWSPAKRSPRLVGAICTLLLLADLLQVWWLVLPSLHIGFDWIDPVAVIALGGVWTCLFLWRLRRGTPRWARIAAKAGQANS